MSLRASASLPSTCSGAMYGTVPRIVPCAVSGVDVASRVIADIEIGPAGAAASPSPKSSSFDARLRQHDVGGLEIAMRDALAVRLVERVGDLDRDLQRLVERQRPFLEARGQRLALEMRHDEVVRAIDAADVVDAADVGMVQGRDGASLALEAGPQIGIASDLTRQDLDRDCPIEARVAGFVDLTHAAQPDLGSDFVRAEAACQECRVTASGCDYRRWGGTMLRSISESTPRHSSQLIDPPCLGASVCRNHQGLSRVE